MLSTKTLVTIEELNLAKDFQYENYYLSKSRFLKSNLTSKTLQILSIFIGILISNIFKLSLIISIGIGYGIVVTYTIVRIHFFYKATIHHQEDYERFIPFWLKSRNCLVGLFATEKKHRQLIGVIGIFSTKHHDICELKRMWVCEKYRHQGSGSLLLETILQESRNLKYKKIILTTAGNLFEAIKFYQKNSFIFIKKITTETILPFNPFHVYYFERNLF